MEPGRAPARFELSCPRCNGPIGVLDGAAALACPHCGERFFLGTDGEVGWLLPPRVFPADALSPAKQRLRERGRHVKRIGEPEGLLVPLYWVRDMRFVWEVRGVGLHQTAEARRVAGGEWISAPGTADDVPDVVWETHGSMRWTVRSWAAHPVSEYWKGKASRVGSHRLVLLDPDGLPAGYRLVAPTLSSDEGEKKLAKWFAARAHRRRARGTRERAALLEHRQNIVSVPLVLVPYSGRASEKGVVVVDGLTGAAQDDVTGPRAEALLRECEKEDRPVPHCRRPVLLPLECPACGWDLALGERNRLFPCPNCGACWEMETTKPRRVRQWFRDDKPNPRGRWLPFWVFGEGAGRARPPESPLFVPAYDGRHPEAQVVLAARLSRTPPQGPWVSEILEPPEGATVGSREAVGLRIAVTGANARGSHDEFMKFITSGDVDSMPASKGPEGLVWLPFQRKGAALVEPTTGAATRAVGTYPWDHPGEKRVEDRS